MAQTNKPSLLIVDDDPLISDTLTYVLSKDFEISAAESRAQVKSLMMQLDEPPQLALVDLGLPPQPHKPDEGFALIADLLGISPSIKILVLSGQSDEANARHARALGAIDFVAKPCEPERLKSLLFNALLVQDAERSADKAPAPVKDSGIVGSSPAMDKLREQIKQYAAAPFPVLIEGESGSGKERVASSLHQLSPRAHKPYLALNCAAISPTLVEPTLFGYAKGAFTGATSARAGYFEEAENGTLFLDEIGELPLELQAKLLRVLENGEYQRVGETQPRFSNARVVTATNRDLRAEIKAGRFRADLYHRLSVFSIAVPPLREMGEDKLTLLNHFRDFYAREAKNQPFSLDARAQQMWEDYHFPGNVRELRNIAIRLTTKYPGLRGQRPATGSRARHRPGLPAGNSAGQRRQGADRVGAQAAADAGQLQPRRHPAPVGESLCRSRAQHDPRQPVAGGQAAGHQPHHAVQPHADLRNRISRLRVF